MMASAPPLLILALARHLHLANILHLVNLDDMEDAGLASLSESFLTRGLFVKAAALPDRGDAANYLIVDEVGAHEEVGAAEEFFGGGDHWITSRPAQELPTGMYLQLGVTFHHPCPTNKGGMQKIEAHASHWRYDQSAFINKK